LRLIDEAADRLTELIDNLLDLQRVAAGQLSTVAAPVDLEMVVRAVVAELSTRSAAHHLEVTADSSLPPVWGDVRRLRQVTQNLVENAIKYSPGGGRVTVRLAEAAEMVEMRVRDEGVGIPSDQLSAIFERFHRVDNSSTRRIGGTGLGLAIVRELVRAQGGAIHAESAGEGQGSTFVVTFPAARA
jgi:signal transduction histidine kinase